MSTKRAANFSAKEESLLINVVKAHKHILECKLTDSRTHSEKSKVWVQIEKDFNGMSGETFRQKEVLGKKYDNIKKRAKKKFADEKCYTRGTGGGPSQTFKLTDVDNIVKEILGTRIKGNESEFDGDSNVVVTANLYENAKDSVNLSDEDISSHDAHQEERENLIIVVNEDSLSSHDFPEPKVSNAETGITQEMTMCANKNEGSNNWAKYDPNMLRTPKSQKLKRKFKETTTVQSGITEKVSQWAEAKTMLEESKNKFLEREHELKLKFMQERQELELTLMKKKSELEMRLMQEESKAKIEWFRKQR